MCLAELVVVLQRDREMDKPVTGAQYDVPATAVGLQATRRVRVGCAGVYVPTCDPGEAAGEVWRLEKFTRRSTVVI